MKQLEIARYDILNSLIEANDFTHYLEIGYQQGICFNEIKCASKLAIDPAPVEGCYNNFTPLFQGTSDEFFSKSTEKFDLIFIDGLHTYEQVARDLENAVKALTPRGLIMLHDMNPSSEERAKSFAEGGMWNGDCFKVAIDLYIGKYPYDYYTINEDNGCMVVNPSHLRSIGDMKKHFIIPQVEHTYQFFDKHRETILNFQEIG